MEAVANSTTKSGAFVHNDSQGGWGVFAAANTYGTAVYGVNHDTMNGWALYGEGRSSGSGMWVNTSDARLKKDIADSSIGLAEVAKLRPVTYRWKDAKHGTDEQLGFLAQDVQKLVPQAVTKGPDGMLMMSYSTLIPALVKAIQEQQAQIASLQARPVNASIYPGGLGLLALAGVIAYLVRRRRSASHPGGNS
jgi:hypothetical protein